MLIVKIMNQEEGSRLCFFPVSVKIMNQEEAYAIEAKEKAVGYADSGDFVKAFSWASKADRLFSPKVNAVNLITAKHIEYVDMMKVPGDGHLYKIFDLTPRATQSEIKKARAVNALLVHPDKFMSEQLGKALGIKATQILNDYTQIKFKYAQNVRMAIKNKILVG